MNSFAIQNCITICILIITVLIGGVRVRQMDNAGRMVFLLLSAALVTECSACWAAIKYHNNILVYTIFSIIEIGLACMYFNYSIAGFRKNNIGIYLAIIGISMGIYNSIFIQSFNDTNSNFLVVEGISIIALSLVSITKIIAPNNYKKIRITPDFYFSLTLLFFWAVTILYWLIHDHFRLIAGDKTWIADLAIFVISVLTNIFFALIFLFYPKMKTLNE